MEKLKPYLKYKIFLMENGIKHQEEAVSLGLARSTFSNKINRSKGNDFSLSEVRKICSKHKIDPNVFFLDI